MVEAWEGDTCVASQTALVRRVAGAKKWSMHARSHIAQINSKVAKKSLLFEHICVNLEINMPRS